MKRTIAILLALLLTCGLITGCGGGETGDTPSPGAEENQEQVITDAALTTPQPETTATAPAVASATPAAVSTETAPPKATSAAAATPQTQSTSKQPASTESKTTPAKTPASTTSGKTTPAKTPASTPAKKPAATPAKPPAAETPAAEPAKKNITVTIGIDCKTYYAKEPEIASRIGPEGIILDKKTVEVPEGSNVYDVIKASGINFVGTSYLNSVAGLSEGDGGPKAGWLYNVNNIYPGIGIKKYIIKDGDHVQVRYTCDGGPDCKATV